MQSAHAFVFPHLSTHHGAAWQVRDMSRLCLTLCLCFALLPWGALARIHGGAEVHLPRMHVQAMAERTAPEMRTLPAPCPRAVWLGGGCLALLATDGPRPPERRSAARTLFHSDEGPALTGLSPAPPTGPPRGVV